MRPRAMKAHCTSIHWLSDSITAGCGMPLLAQRAGSWAEFVGTNFTKFYTSTTPSSSEGERL